MSFRIIRSQRWKVGLNPQQMTIASSSSLHWNIAHQHETLSILAEKKIAFMQKNKKKCSLAWHLKIIIIQRLFKAHKCPFPEIFQEKTMKKAELGMNGTSSATL